MKERLLIAGLTAWAVISMYWYFNLIYGARHDYNSHHVYLYTRVVSGSLHTNPTHVQLR